MKVLVACEYSARVRDAFIARGHDAISADFRASEQSGPHYQGNVFDIIGDDWDLMIAFPPCTYLTKSNAWRWRDSDIERADALNFVRGLLAAPIPKIALENPVGAISTNIRPADQYIQPWHFGDPYQKKTGLWLKNLPLLVPDIQDKPDDVVPWCQARYPDGVRGTRRVSAERERTFSGVAQAMASQWGVS